MAKALAIDSLPSSTRKPAISAWAQKESSIEGMGDPMKTTVRVERTCMVAAVSLILLGSTLVGVRKPQKSSAASTQEKPDALLSAEDFDLSMEPGVKPGVPIRGIVIKDKAWVCSDGETWHAGSPDDRLLYDWAHTPIMPGRQLPPFEKAGEEQRDGQTWLHVKLKVPEKKNRSEAVTAILD